MESTKKILNIYEKLDTTKVMKRFYETANKYKNYIISKDVMLFNEEFLIMPNVNMKDVWDKLDQTHKERFWVYLKILLAMTEQQNTVKEQFNPQFNPYEGIKGGKLGVSNMPKNQLKPAELTTEKIMEMAGLDKLLDPSQLNNVEQKDIDDATLKLKEMLGGNVDEKTSGMFTDILSNIAKELKTTDMKKGNIFENLTSIANNVAEKMKPKVDSGDIDLSSLWESTQNMTNKYKNADMMKMMMSFMNEQNNKK